MKNYKEVCKYMKKNNIEVAYIEEVSEFIDVKLENGNFLEVYENGILLTDVNGNELGQFSNIEEAYNAACSIFALPGAPV